MSYHHLNRFKAHAEAKLTHAERLLAWHFAYEIRQNRSYYSESHRRLAETLQIDTRTARRGLARLVELGLFERINKTGTHAPIYRLLVSCPPNCLDISDHNTAPEVEALKSLVGTSLPTLNSTTTPPYIKKREEEDKEFIEGSVELGLLVFILEGFKNRDDQQEVIWQIAHERPKAMAKAILELLAKASTPLKTNRRKLDYLFKVVRTTPQNLLVKFQEEEKAEKGEALIKASKEDKTFSAANENWKPISNGERVIKYAGKVLAGFEPKKTKFYLSQLDQKLTAKHIFLASDLEVMLEEFTSWAGEDFWREGYLELSESGFPELKHRYGFSLADEVSEQFLTPEEKLEYDTRKQGLKVIEDAWNKENPEQAGSKQFLNTPEALSFLAAHPLTADFGNGKRLLNLFNSRLEARALDYFSQETPEDPEGTYEDFLKDNFTIEDDLENLLARIPERHEGHNRYFKKTLKAYLNALQHTEHGTLLVRAVKEFGFDKREPSQFWTAPNTWIDEQVAQITSKQVRH
jgi:hypothetical protein